MKTILMINRRFLAVAALPLAVSMLGGCGKKVGGQVVAVVNDQEITRQELAAEGQGVQIPPGSDQQTIAVALLQRVVDRNLLAEYARTQGLDRGPEYVARRRLLEQTLLAQLALQKLGGAQAAPTQAEAEAFISSHPTLFARREKLTLDQLQFATPADSSTLKMLTTQPTIEAVVQQLKAKGMRFARAAPVIDTASLDPSVASQITALSNGAVFDISNGGQTFVSAITARASSATQPTAWTASAVSAITRERSQAALEAAMVKLRKSAKIEYDPAFKPKAPAKPNAS